MQKTGCVRIQRTRGDGKGRKCANCGGIGTRRVTFEGQWVKLVVILCKDCSEREYEDLRLQSTIKFPVIA